MASGRVLYGYWRSSAAYRVRIALNLKGMVYETRPVHLVRNGGEQHASDYRHMNPQQLVPCLVDEGNVMTQSLAIMEYLDEVQAEPPLLPPDLLGRARVRAIAQVIACDGHPVGNLRVLQRLQSELGADDEQRAAWSRHWIATSFDAIESMLAGSPETGTFCHGDVPGMADICLVPQCYNAARWKLPLDAYPAITRIRNACSELQAFQRAAPGVQEDAA